MTPEQIAARQDEIAQELYAIHQRQSALWTEQERLLAAQDKVKPTVRQIILRRQGQFTAAQVVADHPEFQRKSIETKFYQLERRGLIRRVAHGRYIVATGSHDR